MEQNNDAVDQNAPETPVVDQQQEQAQPEQVAPIVAQEGSEEPVDVAEGDEPADTNGTDAAFLKRAVEDQLAAVADQDSLGTDHFDADVTSLFKEYFFDEAGEANTVEMVRLLMADEEEVKPAEESVEDEQAAIDASKVGYIEQMDPAAEKVSIEDAAKDLTTALDEEAAAAAAQLAAGDVVEEPAEIVEPAEEVAVESDSSVDEVDPVEPPPEAEDEEDAKVDEEDEAQPDEEEDPTPAEPTSLEGLRATLTGVLPADALAAWDRDTLLTYVETKAQPTKTARGSWPIDLRRGQSMINWTGGELADWVDGLILTPKGMDEELIYDELYKRYRLPNNWTHEAVKAFVQSGEQPAVTEHGVLIEDRMRERKTASQWTHLELRSALLGQIETDLPKEDLVDSLKARLGLSNEFSGQRILETLAETPTEASMDNILLKSKLDEYKDVMSKYGKNLSDDTAGKAQVMLYKAIRQVMARDSVGFTEGWNILLDFINTNYTLLFLPEIARRGYNQLGISKSAALTFEDLVSLLITTRAPGTRQREAKIYKLDQILRYVPNEEERQNVILYYADAQ